MLNLTTYIDRLAHLPIIIIIMMMMKMMVVEMMVLVLIVIVGEDRGGCSLPKKVSCTSLDGLVDLSLSS